VFWVSTTQLRSDGWIAPGPESGETFSDLNRAVVWSEDFDHYRNFALTDDRGVLQPKKMLNENRDSWLFS
jgi:hypothetical protein